MLKPPLYQRYLMREVLAAIALVLAAFLALFTFFNFIDELRNVGRMDYTAGKAALFVLLGLPSLIYELIPIAALIGGLYALATLARHSEIAVLRASGVATSQLLIGLFRVAALLALITFLVGELMVPLGERFAQDVKARALNKVVARSGLASGLWIKDGRSFINVRQVLDDKTLAEVRVYRFTPENTLESVTEARRAYFEAPAQWRLTETQRTELEGDMARVDKAPMLDWRSSVTPELLSVLMIAPERMSLWGLVGYTRHLIDNKQKSERYQIALWKKLVYPLSVFVMLALALPFGYSHNRVGGVSLKIFSGVMLGIVFYALNGLFSNLGVINAWPPIASATAPAAMFLLAAIAMLWWVERR